MFAEGEESTGIPIIGPPHPELQATINVSVVVEINLEKRQNCMIRLPRYLVSQLSAKTEIK
jgi:hypothetical protein